MYLTLEPHCSITIHIVSMFLAYYIYTKDIFLQYDFFNFEKVEGSNRTIISVIWTQKLRSRTTCDFIRYAVERF